MGLSLESLVGGVRTLLGSTIGSLAGSIALGAGLLFGAAGMSGCDENNTNELENFVANAGDSQVSLSWKKPESLELPGVMIRRNVNVFPIDSQDGTLVYEGNAEEYIDTGLDNGTTYCYKAFVFSYTDPMIYHFEWTTSAMPCDEVYAIGWIGGGSNGWKTGVAPPSGTDYQSFCEPNNIIVRNNKVCIDNNGNIYVADPMNHRVCKWDVTGNAQGWIGGGSNGWKTTSNASFGNDYQSFREPGAVFVDANGFIFIVDTQGYCLHKWDSNGNALGWIGGGQDGWQTGNMPPLVGTDYRSFYASEGLFVDSSGNIYVADFGNARVSKWNPDGICLGWIGGGSNGWKTTDGPNGGSDYQSFCFPTDVCVDSNGNIYVSEINNGRVSKWAANGNALGWIGGGSNGWKTGSAPTTSYDYQSFRQPTGVFVKDGFLYIADGGNNRICKWTLEGNALGWIGNGQDGWQTGSVIIGGSDFQSFSNPGGVHVDLDGNIFVSEYYNHRVCKWQD